MKKEITPPDDLTVGSIHDTNSHGKVEVLAYYGAFEVIVEFIDTGFVIKTFAAGIRRGQVKDKYKPTVYGIGFFGEGDHVSSIKRKPNPAYKSWQAMLQRCYDEKYQLFRPTYVGCSVCSEWHNFQNFANWFNDNYPVDGGKYQLDKDIKVKGNKIYSPSTCLFVTLKENTIEASAKKHKLKNPLGEEVEIYNLNEFCKGTKLDASHLMAVSKGTRKSHQGWTK